MDEITAKSWAVGRDGEIITGKESSKSREIASLTKIMTCYLALIHIETEGVPFDTSVTISKQAAETGGTSAKLRRGEKYKLIDLFYGMMLPSGNDAAVTIAEFIGKRISYSKKKTECVKTFVREMNELAGQLDLKDTIFKNPHGMSRPKNVSSAENVCKLAFVAMQNWMFRSIVRTKEYTVLVNKKNSIRTNRWDNTNKLLGKEWIGVKTGITPKAGYCLCACNTQGVIVVALACLTANHRWEEVQKLTELAQLVINN